MITFLGCLGLLVAAYFTYGRYLERLCGVDAARPVPSATSFDGVDYIPMRQLSYVCCWKFCYVIQY